MPTGREDRDDAISDEIRSALSNSNYPAGWEPDAKAALYRFRQQPALHHRLNHEWWRRSFGRPAAAVAFAAVALIAAGLILLPWPKNDAGKQTTIVPASEIPSDPRTLAQTYEVRRGAVHGLLRVQLTLQPAKHYYDEPTNCSATLTFRLQLSGGDDSLSPSAAFQSDATIERGVDLPVPLVREAKVSSNVLVLNGHTDAVHLAPGPARTLPMGISYRTPGGAGGSAEAETLSPAGGFPFRLTELTTDCRLSK